MPNRNRPDTDRSRPDPKQRLDPELWQRADEAFGSIAPGIVRSLIGRALKEYGSDVVRDFIEVFEQEVRDDPVRFWFGLMNSQKTFTAGIAKDELGQFRSVRYVLERQVFREDPVLARRFRDAVFEPALDLNLKGNPAHSVLAYNLGRLYSKTVDELKDTTAAMELCRNYVDWLLGKDWEAATLNVLRSDSAAFDQFRRETDPTWEHPDDAA